MKLQADFFFFNFQKDLQAAPCFSIEVDESTDISVKKLLSYTVRYYSIRFNDIRETFMDIEEITSATAVALFEQLKALIQRWGLNPLNFVGLGVDGASVMDGVKHSLKTLAKAEYPNLEPMKCAAHTLDLCARDAFDILPAQLDWLLRESYNWFAHSAQRQQEYKTVLDMVGFDNIVILDDNEENGDVQQGAGASVAVKRPPMQLISPSTTRWLVMADCVERVLKQV